MGCSILISGAFGFVGSNLVKSLSGENRLLALDVRQSENSLYSEYYSWADLGKISWNEIDIIIHLAGKAHDTRNRAKSEEYFEINTGLTRKIFEFFLVSGAKKFIYFSSVKAAANAVDGVLSEDVNPSPVGPYGESKLAAERYLAEAYKDYAGATMADGDLESRGRGNRDEKQLYILRPCMIHGPGNKGNLNNLVNLVNKGIPYPLGAFLNQRSFTSIDNLCFVINELISRDIPSDIYNIADDDPVSTNDLVKIIAEVSGKRGKTWNVNRNLIHLLATAGSLLHMPFNTDALNKLTEDYVVSNKKIKKALGISQMPVGALEGLRKSLSDMVVKRRGHKMKTGQTAQLKNRIKKSVL